MLLGQFMQKKCHHIKLTLNLLSKQRHAAISYWFRALHLVDAPVSFVASKHRTNLFKLEKASGIHKDLEIMLIQKLKY